MKTLGEIIREERLQREMTMKQFAGLLGVTPVYISEIENGNRIPTNDKFLAQLSAVLSIAVSELHDIGENSRLMAKFNKEIGESPFRAKLQLARTLIKRDVDDETLLKIKRILEEDSIER